MEDGGPSPRRRKLAGLDSLEAAKPAPAAAKGHGLEPAAADQDPPLPVAEGGAATTDRISDLPDDVLGKVISLLPTKDGARSQVLASRWRRLWRSAPLNLNYNGLCQDQKKLGDLLSRILSAHGGPSRRFCVPVYHFHGDRVDTADALLRSPALRELQELELTNFQPELPYRSTQLLPSPAAIFRFSETLCVAIIGDCQFPEFTAQAIHFPKLKKLELERVCISDSSLNAMIGGCPALECLLIAHCHGFSNVEINSISLRSIGLKGHQLFEGIRFEELMIENAPCLERLLQRISWLHTSVKSAPKLETLGCLSTDARFVLESSIIQGLRVDSLMPEVRTIKILAVGMRCLSLDDTIDLMRCFPCLERLYIESGGPAKTNLLRREHQDLCINLRKITWRYYRGIKSHVDFATFFVLNARVLELMTFQVYAEDYNGKFFAQQHKKLQLDRKASRGARFQFTRNTSHRRVMDFHLHDLDLADPFETKDPGEFYALS